MVSLLRYRVRQNQSHCKISGVITILCFLAFSISWPTAITAQGPTTQSLPNESNYYEQQTVYLANLKRAAHGVPPLRFNRQLTEAARWFSWDSTENRPPGFCGHLDTNGQWPSQRIPPFGYHGFAGAENCFCGYVDPDYAVEGWYNSPGHKANMLNPDSWELGSGYYRRSSDGRGYVTHDFGHDPAYPPVVINQEAIRTGSPEISLYIYSNDNQDGISGLGPATDMMVANNPCFIGATWEAYSPTKSWSLPSGTGRRTVYVKTRDGSGRSTVVEDTIYLGSSIPYEQLGLAQGATRSEEVELYELNGNGLPLMQFSLGWVVEMEKGDLWWGNGEVVPDSAASAGHAYRLRPGDGNSFLWDTPVDYPHNLASQAYFRLKVDDNSSPATVARLAVRTNEVERDFLEITGTDFNASGVYQEFPLDFIQYDDDDYPWLILSVDRQNSATVYVDRVVVFTAPEVVRSRKSWPVPGRNYRGGTVWVRYTDNAGTFSAITEAVTRRSELQVVPSEITFLGDETTTVPAAHQLRVGYGTGCEHPPWTVHSSQPWLTVTTSTAMISLQVESAGLQLGTHQATLTVRTNPEISGSPQTIPVTYHRVDSLQQTFLPVAFGK